MYNVCHSKYFYMVIIIIFHGFKEAKGEGPGLIQEFLVCCSVVPIFLSLQIGAKWRIIVLFQTNNHNWIILSLVFTFIRGPCTYK